MKVLFWVNALLVVINGFQVDGTPWGAFHLIIAMCSLICMYGLMEPRK